MSRHVILSAFVHLSAMAARVYPANGEERDLRKGERVDPPGEVELTDPDQVDRLIKAKAIRPEGDGRASPAAPGSSGGRHIGKPGEAPGGGAASVSHGGKPGKGQGGKGGKGKAGAANADPRSSAAGGASGGVARTDGGAGGDGAESNPGGGDGGSPGAGGSPE